METFFKKIIRIIIEIGLCLIIIYGFILLGGWINADILYQPSPQELENLEPKFETEAGAIKFEKRLEGGLIGLVFGIPTTLAIMFFWGKRRKKN